MKPETQKKINACKALNGMSVADLIATDRFRNNLGAYMIAQREDRKQIRASYEAMRKMGGAKGYKLPAHTIDRVMDLSVEEFTNAFASIINGVSKRTASEREYIAQLGFQAYNLTVIQYVIEEFPELEKELIPKTNEN